MSKSKKGKRSVEQRSNPFENPGTPLTSVALLEMFGGGATDSGVSVSPETAFSISFFYRCTTLLAGLVGAFPLYAYRVADRQRVPCPAIETPATGTPFEQQETIMLHLLGWGNAYVQKIRNKAGQIVDLQPIYPGRVKLDLLSILDPETGQRQPAQKIFTIQNAPDNPYTTLEIMHIPGPSTDGIRGMSIVEHARQSLGIAKASETLAAKQMGNGSMLGGMLTTDKILKPEEATQMKQRWRDTVAGVKHAGDIFVSGAGTKFLPMQMSNADAQFLMSRSWQAADICTWFGIPPVLAGLVEKTTSWGTGIEQQNLALLKFTVNPWIIRYEQRVTLELLSASDQFAQFFTDDLLRAEQTTRYAAYASALQSRWMTPDEVRGKENMQPLPNGQGDSLLPAPAAAIAVNVPPAQGASVPAPPGTSPSTDDDDNTEN